MRTRVALIPALFFLAVPLCAGTIFGRFNDYYVPDGNAHRGSYQLASWSQTGSYYQVSILAPLRSDDAVAQDITFWLMNMIGPGTTLDNQIATTTLMDVGFDYATYRIFDGLTLGPGTYYLVMNGNYSEALQKPLARWLEAYDSGLSVLTDVGVTDGGDRFIWSQTGIDSGYPPASAGFQTNSKDGALLLLVETPEPVAIGTVGLALAVFFASRRLRARRG